MHDSFLLRAANAPVSRPPFSPQTNSQDTPRLEAGTSSAYGPRAARRASRFGLNRIPRTLINMEDERSSRISILVGICSYIWRGASNRWGSRGFEDLRVRSSAPSGRTNKLRALKDELHLSSPVGRIDGGSDARLLNMTDRSLGKPSKCTVRTEAILHPGDAGSAILVIVRNRAAFLPPLGAFLSPAVSPPSGICNVDGKRRETPSDAFTSSNYRV